MNQNPKPTNYPPYFCQNEKWTNFWQKAAGQNHKIFTFQNLQIYEYPWEIFGRRIGTFWYIPKAKISLETWQEFLQFLNVNSQKSKKRNKKYPNFIDIFWKNWSRLKSKFLGKNLGDLNSKLVQNQTENDFLQSKEKIQPKWQEKHYSNSKFAINETPEIEKTQNEFSKTENKLLPKFSDFQSQNLVKIEGISSANYSANNLNNFSNYRIDFVKIDLDPTSEICLENTQKFQNRPDLLTFDLDLEIQKTNQKTLENLQKTLENWQNSQKSFSKRFKIQKSFKKIQYLLATTINLTDKTQNPKTGNQNPKKFATNFHSDSSSSNLETKNEINEQNPDLGELKTKKSLNFVGNQKTQNTTIFTKRELVQNKEKNVETKTLEIQKIEPKMTKNQILGNSKIIPKTQNSLQNYSNSKENSKNPQNQKYVDLVDFYEQNTTLWQSFNERVRRYSRKILREYQTKYQIITAKSDQLFEDFYQLHLETSLRQKFPTQSKEYLRELFWQDFVRIIVIKKNNYLENVTKNKSIQTNLKSKVANKITDKIEISSSNLNSKNSLETKNIDKINEKNSQNLKINLNNLESKTKICQKSELAKVEKEETENDKQQVETEIENYLENSTESVFLGLVLDGTLTYLLGGNSENALKNHLQYLLQIQALLIAFEEKCHFYDMGGWENGSGYGEFKNGYRGSLRVFFGPFDLIISPFRYRFFNFIINFGKLAKKLLNK